MIAVVTTGTCKSLQRQKYSLPKEVKGGGVEQRANVKGLHLQGSEAQLGYKADISNANHCMLCYQIAMCYSVYTHIKTAVFKNSPYTLLFLTDRILIVTVMRNM